MDNTFVDKPNYMTKEIKTCSLRSRSYLAIKIITVESKSIFSRTGRGGNHTVRVLVEVNPWEEDGCCRKEKGRNQIVGGGAWSSHTKGGPVAARF
ncbi:hypothetical protein TIFTF001_045872 [Ficus carica]|uniref:Uncharacterized protein n=1 Tax=Ficus carica TaxID=3494 RepID=A0AA88D1Q8_FICCA|nr:hypothetical protein TIFTF001_045872 [Ficus carica]